MTLHLDSLDSPCIYQTQQTNQTEYYASRILLLPEAPCQQCLVQTVLYTDNTSSSTTREQKTLITRMVTLHMHTMNCVKWKFLVRNNWKFSWLMTSIRCEFQILSVCYNWIPLAMKISINLCKSGGEELYVLCRETETLFEFLWE